MQRESGREFLAGVSLRGNDAVARAKATLRQRTSCT